MLESWNSAQKVAGVSNAFAEGTSFEAEKIPPAFLVVFPVALKVFMSQILSTWMDPESSETVDS